uniref:protein-serine/threonine phosphatase n=1 Tax=Lupinus angustifolius TaxID=3871 RepID=A0A0D6DQE9_LUPAN|nr:similar to probable protein phosphatase 2C [Lupinus angustifolius]
MSPCWSPFDAGESSSRNVESSGRFVGLLWHKDSGRHLNGEFSMAVVQANNLLEDHSQLESGPLCSVAASPQGTYVGIYDGHGGPEAARFVNDHLFKNIKSKLFFILLVDIASLMTVVNAEFTSENQGMSADVITKAFLATEEEFLSIVKKQWVHKPQIASVGACVLVGVICSGHLYIANAGDSRAVLGRRDFATKEIKAVQLSYEHNASFESVRDELRSLHPDDPHIVVMKHKVWRVKGLIQRSSLCFFSVVPNLPLQPQHDRAALHYEASAAFSKPMQSIRLDFLRSSIIICLLPKLKDPIHGSNCEFSQNLNLRMESKRCGILLKWVSGEIRREGWEIEGWIRLGKNRVRV